MSLKKGVYNAKIKNIEDKILYITSLVAKTTLNAKINQVKGEVPSITDLATNVSVNGKIYEVKGEIPNITNLATTSALTAVKNKIPSVSNLAEKADDKTRINEIEKKITDHKYDQYITTPEFNKFTVEMFDLKLKSANLAR